MARDHARIHLAIWDDDEFRALSPAAQHLYFVLTIHPTLSYCGVADWRPGRVAGFAGGWNAQAVEAAAEELAAGLFIVIDEDTEEVLLRSFVRNDELMEQPNMAVAMRKAHRAVASPMLRGVLVHELLRLHSDKPDLKGWAKVSEMLEWASVDPSANPSRKGSVIPSGNPSGKGSDRPSVKDYADPSENPSDHPSPTPAPNSILPTPDSSGPRKRGTRIPNDWRPGTDLVAAMRSEGIPDDLARRELPKFRDYWAAKSGREAVKVDWDATWRNWLRTARERTGLATVGPAVERPKNHGGW